eukprot:1812620-Amphidinium_carterae.1
MSLERVQSSLHGAVRVTPVCKSGRFDIASLTHPPCRRKRVHTTPRTQMERSSAAYTLPQCSPRLLTEIYTLRGCKLEAEEERAATSPGRTVRPEAPRPEANRRCC